MTDHDPVRSWAGIPEDAVKVKFSQDRYWWTIQAEDSRFIVLTRQATFHPKGELVYTCIDRDRGVRGPCNLIGQGWDFDTLGPTEGSRTLLEALNGDWEYGDFVEVSYRNNVQVKITQWKDSDERP